MSNKVPYQKNPCKNCPFRKDSMKGWLGKGQVEEITTQSSFVCHKRNDLQCAGHMILMKETNSFNELARVLKMELPLKNKELVFDSIEDMKKHHQFNSEHNG